MQSMAFLDEPPLNLLLAALFLLVAVGSAWRGTRLLLKGLREGSVDMPAPNSGLSVKIA